MRTAVRLGGYATALAIAFGTAFGVGSAVGEPPAATPFPPAGHSVDHSGADHRGSDHSGAATDGLAATSAGYTLVPSTHTLEPGRPGGYAFTVTGPDGAPVTAFDAGPDRPLHLVVVRRDAAGFQHLYPEPGPDGVWRVPLTLPAGGVYRVYADFSPAGGPPLVLGTDLFAPGDFTPLPFAPSRVAGVDRYQVRLDGELVPGTPSPVFATVSLDGAPVTDLQPHLGAFGHLVAVRRSDLAYLRVRPDLPAPAAGDRSGPGVPFVAEVPSAGGYRLFLEFRHGGVVRTAEFTVDVG